MKRGSAMWLALAVATLAGASGGAGEPPPDSKNAELSRAIQEDDVRAAFAAMETIVVSGGARAEATLARAFGSLPVALDAGKAPASGPAPVAVHYKAHVPGYGS